MPEICRFYGVVIKMFWMDHPPPHFHAEYGGEAAVIEIESLALLGGSLPGRALGLVVEWAALHRAELLALWEKARAGEPMWKLEPLR